MISFTRILLLLTFALFWGGLTFYTGFVVRISHSILDDPFEGGLITQQATGVLQWLAVAAIGLMAINGFAVHKRRRKPGAALLICSAILTVAVAGLFIVHEQLDAVISRSEGGITNREAFDAGHRHYNQLTTIEWLTTLAYLPITVLAWRSIDTDTAVMGPDAQSSDETSPV